MFDCIIAVNSLEQASELRRQLESGGFPINVIGAITEWNSLLNIISEFRVDVLIVEVNLKNMGKLESLSQTLRLQPSCAVVLASNEKDLSYDLVSDALELGVQGYIMLPVEEKHLSRAMGSVVRWLFNHRDTKSLGGTVPVIEEAAEQKKNLSLAEEIYLYISENYVTQLTMADITGHFHISESYVNRLLMKNYGSSFKKILNRVRLDQAKIQLRENPQTTIGEISRNVGYMDEGYFYRLYKAYTGVTPSNDRHTDPNEPRGD